MRAYTSPLSLSFSWDCYMEYIDARENQANDEAN